MSTVIKIENLYKEYSLGVIGHGTLYRDLQSFWAKVRGTDDPNSIIYQTKNKATSGQILALNNINLEILEGEVLGIIGMNGAGKSTLLKVLSRITAPTKGQIKVKGRIASLLEVGTGFHGELTGRENIYLNGAINGMYRKDISKKLDEIVDFAGIDQFVDTPVKRYSSGMNVRLGFSVAAHLDSEILVIDEVLAVGDISFQKKCLSKIGSVSKENRTVLFVSHNMSSIQSLCSRAVLLDSGHLVSEGNTNDIIENYLEKNTKKSIEVPLDKRTDRLGSGKVTITSLRVLNKKGLEVSALLSGEDYSFEICYVNNTNFRFKNVVACIDILDKNDNRILVLRSTFTKDSLELSKKSGTLLCSVKNLPLALGLYNLVLFLSHADAEILDAVVNAGVLNVDGGDYFGTGSAGMPDMCKILMKMEWSAK